MRKDQLAPLLAAAVSIPFCLLNAACESPCPYTEVLETETSSVDAAVACEVAQAREQAFEGILIPAEDCADFCGDAKYNRCSLDTAYLEVFDSANPDGAGDPVTCPAEGATLTCEVTEQRGELHSGCAVPGRRPEGLADIKHDLSAVGRHLACSAYFEAASVIAFERLAEELRGLGAPEELVLDLARAARDEVRHAEAMSGLAGRYAAAVPVPSVAPAAARGALDIALENAVEGLVNETFAAATARFAAENAADPEIRAAMTVIADDECAHAALAFRIAAFLEGLLDEAALARVEARRRAAIRALPASIEEPGPAVRRLAGVPTRGEALIVYNRMCRSVWGSPGVAGRAPSGRAAAPVTDVPAPR